MRSDRAPIARRARSLTFSQCHSAFLLFFHQLFFIFITGTSQSANQAASQAELEQQYFHFHCRRFTRCSYVLIISSGTLCIVQWWRALVLVVVSDGGGSGSGRGESGKVMLEEKCCGNVLMSNVLGAAKNSVSFIIIISSSAEAAAAVVVAAERSVFVHGRPGKRRRLLPSSSSSLYGSSSSSHVRAQAASCCFPVRLLLCPLLLLRLSLPLLLSSQSNRQTDTFDL